MEVDSPISFKVHGQSIRKSNLSQQTQNLVTACCPVTDTVPEPPAAAWDIAVISQLFSLICMCSNTMDD